MTIARYWRQVHEVQRQTHVSARIARQAVRAIRDTREITSAHATKQHPRIVARIVRDILEAEEPLPGKPYTDLDEFVSVYEAWDGDYEEYTVEASEGEYP